MKTKFLLHPRISPIRQAMTLLENNQKKKIYVSAVVQSLLSILDLLGVAIIGVLGAMSVRGVQSGDQGNLVGSILKFLHLSDFSFQIQTAVLAFVASFLLVSRTVMSMYFNRRMIHFLSNCSSGISEWILSRFANLDLIGIRRWQPQDMLYFINAGCDVLTIRLIGTSITLVADFFLLVLMCGGLFLVDPIVAFCTIGIFIFVGLILYFSMQERAHKVSFENTTLRNQNSGKLLEFIGSYRELTVQSRKNKAVFQLVATRKEIASSSAELSFLPTVSKYVIEIVMVIGTLMIGASQFIFQDADLAVAKLAVFLAAGTRIAPAVLRIQQGAIQVRSSSGEAIAILELIDSFKETNANLGKDKETLFDYPDFNASVLVEKISYSYASGNKVLKDINLMFEPGMHVAIVGPSGSGKTTLVDLILGVLHPSAGQILISGKSPNDAAAFWPGAISYVPQDVFISNDSLFANIGMGDPVSAHSISQVMSALHQANLDDLVSNLPNGIETVIGQNGLNLSGGQRQRIGIARALYSNPKLLILDEATSSLDAITESEVAKSISGLKKNVTVISIAHRLSTVQDSDLVVYIDGGEIIANGSFEHVRGQVPDFDSNAKLLGL